MRKVFVVPGIFIILAILLPCVMSAAIIHVPADQLTIQAGIDEAVIGDTVLVADGMYTGDGNRDIDPIGKDLHLMSENGPESCIIDCQGSAAENHRGFHVHSSESDALIIEGFTILNGFISQPIPIGYGGGIYCRDSSLTINNCHILNCYSQNSGGGLHCYNSSVIIKDCLVIGNGAYNSGGGIGVGSDSVADIRNSTIFQNYTENHSGGGIFYDGWTSGSIVGCTITENYAANRGGGICSNTADIAIRTCTISDNCSHLYGGGILKVGSGMTEISNCLISGNSTEAVYPANGGGMCIYNGAVITNCVFTNNSANNDEGGALALIADDSVIPEIWNCLFVENSSGTACGGIYCIQSSPLIVNCTLFGNTSPSNSSIYCDDTSNPLIINSILWNETVNQIEGPGTPTVTYSDIKGGYPGIGNIDADPLLVPGPLGDYYLSHIAAGQAENSPCINAGSDLAQNICFDMSWGQICLNELTTRADEVTDSDIVDIGYHYFDDDFRPIPTTNVIGILGMLIAITFILISRRF